MATISNLVSVSLAAQADHQDTMTWIYRVEYDAPPSNPYTALIAAQTASANPVPVRRARYAGASTAALFVTSIAGQADNPEASMKIWLWTVTFGVPPAGELNGFEFANPLDRPPIYNVEYMDREYVIEKAYNKDAFPHGDGNGGSRAALTLAPISTTAGERPDEPQMDTDRLEVLVIRKSYPTLDAIVQKNRNFKRTTNSDPLIGYQKRQLKYLLTESEGIQYENGVEFWPGVTTILAEDTTDLILDNVGTQYWDPVDEKIKRTQDLTPTPLNLVNLDINGQLGGLKTGTLTYYYLTEKAYASLIV